MRVKKRSTAVQGRDCQKTQRARQLCSQNKQVQMAGMFTSSAPPVIRSTRQHGRGQGLGPVQGPRCPVCTSAWCRHAPFACAEYSSAVRCGSSEPAASPWPRPAAQPAPRPQLPRRRASSGPAIARAEHRPHQGQRRKLGTARPWPAQRHRRPAAAAQRWRRHPQPRRRRPLLRTQNRSFCTRLPPARRQRTATPVRPVR